MLYDIFIGSLTVFGVIGTLFYSYKIARSRVYVVGLVRESENLARSATLNSSGSVAINEQAMLRHPIPVSAFEGEGVSSKKKWQCGRCGEEIEELDEEFRCLNCGNVVDYLPSDPPLAGTIFAAFVDRRTRKDQRLQALGQAIAEAEVATEKDRLRAEWNELFKIVHSETMGDAAGRLFEKVSRSEKLGGVQTRIDKVASVESKQVELQNDLSEHEDVLEEHSKMLMVLEKRLRKVEIESVHRVQEFSGERVSLDGQFVN